MPSIAKNTGYLYLKVVVNILVSLYTMRIVLGALGTEDFGLWGVVGGAIAFLSFLNPALSQATQRFMSFYEGQGNREKQRRVFSASIVIHFVVAVFILLVLEAAAWPLFHGILNVGEGREHAAQVVYQCLIATTFFSFISVPYDAIINAHEDMRYYSLVGIAEAFLKLFAALLLTQDFVSEKLETYGLLHFAISVIVLIAMRVYCRMHYKEARFIRSLVDRGTVKEMGKFAFWNTTGQFSTIVGNHGDGIVSNHFFGTTVNAALSITGQLCGYLSIFSTNLMKAVNPVITKRAGGGKQSDMLRYTVESCKFVSLLFTFLAVPVWIETPFVLKVWLNAVPVWAVLFIRLQFVRWFFDQITHPLRTAINANGRIARLNVWCASTQVLAPVILTGVFMLGGQPYWHLIIGGIFINFFPGIALLYYAHKCCGMSYRYYACQAFLPCCLTLGLATGTGLALHFLLLNASDVVRFLAVGTGHVLVFVPCAYYIALNAQERSYMAAIVVKVKNKLAKFRR